MVDKTENFNENNRSDYGSQLFGWEGVPTDVVSSESVSPGPKTQTPSIVQQADELI